MEGRETCTQPRRVLDASSLKPVVPHSLHLQFSPTPMGRDGSRNCPRQWYHRGLSGTSSLVPLAISGRPFWIKKKLNYD